MPNKDTERKFVVTRTDCRKALDGDKGILTYIQQVFGIDAERGFVEFIYTRANQFDPRLRIKSFDMTGLIADYYHISLNAAYSAQYKTEKQATMRKKIILLYKFASNFECNFIEELYSSTFIFDYDAIEAFYKWALSAINETMEKLKPKESTLLEEYFFNDRSIYFLATEQEVHPLCVEAYIKDAIKAFKRFSDQGFVNLICMLSGTNLSSIDIGQIATGVVDTYWPLVFTAIEKHERRDVFSLLSERFDYVEDYKKYNSFEEPGLNP